jgi:hypothetical protein
MKYIKDLRDLLIIILAIIIVFLQFKGCGKETKVPDTITDTKIEYRDVKVEVPVYIPEIQKIPVPREVPSIIDTIAVVEDYYTKYKVIDTVYLNSPDSGIKYFGYGIITDIINKNKIQERSLIWNYKVPKIITTTTIKEKPKNQVYAGVTSGLNKSTFIDNISTGIIVKNKTDHLYQISVGLGNRGGVIGPFVQGGIYWKIRLKKPKVEDYVELSK